MTGIAVGYNKLLFWAVVLVCGIGFIGGLGVGWLVWG